MLLLCPDNCENYLPTNRPFWDTLRTKYCRNSLNSSAFQKETFKNLRFLLFEIKYFPKSLFITILFNFEDHLILIFMLRVKTKTKNPVFEYLRKFYLRLLNYISKMSHTFCYLYLNIQRICKKYCSNFTRG